MSITDEIARLHELRTQGALSGSEFEQAKSALLAQASASAYQPASAPSSPFHEELARIDREWLLEREQYMIATKYGNTVASVSLGDGIGLIFVMGVGCCWTLLAFTIGAPWFFTLIGLLIPLMGLLNAGTSLSKASRYKRAEQAYQQRRAATLARHGQSNTASNYGDLPLYR